MVLFILFLFSSYSFLSMSKVSSFLSISCFRDSFSFVNSSFLTFISFIVLLRLSICLLLSSVNNWLTASISFFSSFAFFISSSFDAIFLFSSFIIFFKFSSPSTKFEVSSTLMSENNELLSMLNIGFGFEFILIRSFCVMFNNSFFLEGLQNNWLLLCFLICSCLNSFFPLYEIVLFLLIFNNIFLAFSSASNFVFPSPPRGYLITTGEFKSTANSSIFSSSSKFFGAIIVMLGINEKNAISNKP